jgi:hypothetical protein
MKYDLKKSLRVPLTAGEQQIEDALPTVKIAPNSQQVAAVRKAAAQALQSMRGAVTRPAAD